MWHALGQGLANFRFCTHQIRKLIQGNMFLEDFSCRVKHACRKILEFGLINSWETCIWNQYLSKNMNWQFGIFNSTKGIPFFRPTVQQQPFNSLSSIFHTDNMQNMPWHFRKCKLHCSCHIKTWVMQRRSGKQFCLWRGTGIYIYIYIYITIIKVSFGARRSGAGA